MKTLPACAALLALSGCASIASLREASPRQSYASHRSTAALEECLAGSLSWIGAPSVIHGETSTELAFGRGFGDSFLLIRIRAAGIGSAIEVREQDRYGGKVRRSVEGCL